MPIVPESLILSSVKSLGISARNRTMTTPPKLKSLKTRHRRRNPVSIEIEGDGAVNGGAIDASS